MSVIFEMHANRSAVPGHPDGSCGAVVVVEPALLLELLELALDVVPVPVRALSLLSLPPRTTKPTTTATTTAAARSRSASVRLPRRAGMAIACGAPGSHDDGGGALGGGGAGGGADDAVQNGATGSAGAAGAAGASLSVGTSIRIEENSL